MPARPVQISIDDELLARIDADPEVQRDGRSAFIRSAARLYLEARRRRNIDDTLRSAFDGRADALLSDVEDLLGSQAWPGE